MSPAPRKRRGRAAPSDPMRIALERAAARERARDPAEWGVAAGALTQAVNADVVARTDLRGRVVHARRQDVFDLFQARGRLGAADVAAVRRLQADLAVLHHTLSAGGDATPRVDGSRAPDAFSDRRLAAGQRIEDALGRSGVASARLLRALCEGEVVAGRREDWRAVVARVSGETLADAQGAAVRLACENLAGAYAEVDRARRAAR